MDQWWKFLVQNFLNFFFCFWIIWLLLVQFPKGHPYFNGSKTNLRITSCKESARSEFGHFHPGWPPFLLDLSKATRFSPIPEINGDCVPDYSGFTLLNVCISSRIYFPFWYAWNGRKTADSPSQCYKLVTMFLQMESNTMIWVDVQCNETLIKRLGKWFRIFNVSKHP